MLSALEEVLGAYHFTRTIWRIALTEEGEIHFRHCLRFLEDLEQVEARHREEAKLLEGSVKIKASERLGEQTVTPLLCGIEKAYPLIRNHSELTGRNIS